MLPRGTRRDYAAPVVRVTFTANLARHVPCAPVEVAAASLRDVLEAAFRERPGLRDYVFDDRAQLRRHMCVFVDGRQIADRVRLAEPVPEGGEVYVMQALSGG